MSALDRLRQHILLTGQAHPQGFGLPVQKNNGRSVVLIASRARRVLIHELHGVYPISLTEAAAQAWLDRLRIKRPA